MDEERFARVLDNDATADGRFVYAVVTTGVYCRPSCPSRAPRRDHVRFFDTAREAEESGYRPCRRCRPGAGDAVRDAVIRACRAILDAPRVPSVAELAERVGTSPSTLHRWFRAQLGVTPRAFAAAPERDRLVAALEPGRSVTDAAFLAGYASPSRLDDRATALLGMTPAAYRDGGGGVEVRFAIGESSLGAVLVACSARGVVAIDLGSDPDVLIRGFQDRLPGAALVGADAAFEDMVARVVGLVEAPHRDVDLPLDVRGTAFQQRVWTALRQIPAGERRSYKALAESLGRPTGARAVARACASNRIAVAIPCHRVVRGDGGLGGYRWGIDRKQALLAAEAG